MSDGPFPFSATLRRPVLPRLLFWLNLGVAATLAVLVGVAPLLDDGSGPKLMALFSQDATVRQTALAAAIGLAVTAWVFFRSLPSGGDSIPTPRLPPPNNMVGA
jgi:hypothetical protein